MHNCLKRLLAAGILAVLTSCSLNEPGYMAYYNRFTGTYATDQKGVRRSSKDYGNDAPPWLEDLVYGVAPAYSYRERAARHQGRGFFQLILDLETGSVVTVKVAKSTGFKALDDSAVTAFRQWRWKPHKWKEIDIPVTFVIARTPLPRGAVRLPPAT